ncbi:hypothetical protein [uncultured Pseudomonas sp.]|uniref:hypothetical protein n=1 Tax=uncultured Pseudomonas sp. TaxID=114707 RepID=UPI00258E8A1D|nr:hypothetical protein [uncultured Pseudomonas sp.]
MGQIDYTTIETVESIIREPLEALRAYHYAKDAITMTDLLEDVVGMNEAGLICHPYKLRRGKNAGKYSYTLETDNNLNYIGTDEAGLRALIEAGAFDERGRIRMLPAGAPPGTLGSALSVRCYLGRPLQPRNIPLSPHS